MASNIDRRALRALPDELVEIALEAIDDYGAEFKFRKNVLYVYAPDGTTPLSVGPKDAGPALKKARTWMNKHFPEPPKGRVKAQPEALTDEQLQELADKFSNAEHHPEEKALAKEDPLWVPYVSPKKVTSPYFEVNTETGEYRCKQCIGTDHQIGKKWGPKSFGGHVRMWHTDRSNLYSKEAQEKKIVTRRRREASASAEVQEDSTHSEAAEDTAGEPAVPEVAPESTEKPEEAQTANPASATSIDTSQVDEWKALAIKQEYVISLAKDLDLSVVDVDLVEENEYLTAEVDRLEKSLKATEQKLADATAKLALVREQFQAAFNL